MSQEPFITKLHLRNFKSFKNETIDFDNPLFLVGKNGSGKSNLVGVFEFLADCMGRPLQDAINNQGNIWNSHASTPIYPPPLAIRADFQDAGPQKKCGFYAFSLELSPLNELIVTQEQCSVSDNNGTNLAWFDRTRDQFHTNVPGLQPEFIPNALALPVIGGIEKFAPVVRAFRAMRIYAIQPNSFRVLQEPGGDVYLKRDGSNIASILEKLTRQHPQTPARIVELISSVVPGITAIEARRLGGNGSGSKLGLLFAQQSQGNEGTLFDAASMSDGTLAILALVVVSMQDPAPTLIAIEEPESYVHSGALSSVANLIQRAAQRCQVVITTHSSELLDTKWLQSENMRVVEWEKGATYVSPLGSAPVKALQLHLAGMGELLRSNLFEAAPHHESSETSLFAELTP